MTEIFTLEEVKFYMRDEVRAAGGAKKWLRKHKLRNQFDHVLHMVENGDAATSPPILDALGFRRITRYVAEEQS